jgi:hypothetical protein
VAATAHPDTSGSGVLVENRHHRGGRGLAFTNTSQKIQPAFKNPK